MGKLICKLVLLFGISFCSLDLSAYDGLKSKKKNHDPKIEVKKPLLATKTDVEDTLVFEKAKEDTLIFADDELNHQNFKKHDKQINDAIDLSNHNGKGVSLNTSLYPNPSDGVSWVEVSNSLSSTTEIIITTLEGKFVRNDTFLGNKYQIEDLASGTYLITLKNGKEVIRKRLFVN